MIKEALLGKSHLEIASTLNDQAVLLVKQDKLKEAMPLYLRGLEIRENILGKGG
jgi:hypothetical protein